MIRGSGCSKSRLGKAACAEVAVQQRQENGTLLWGEAYLQAKMWKTDGLSKNGMLLWHETHLQVKMCKTPVLAHFGAYDVEKVSDRKEKG